MIPAINCSPLTPDMPGVGPQRCDCGWALPMRWDVVSALTDESLSGADLVVLVQCPVCGVEHVHPAVAHEVGDA